MIGRAFSWLLLAASLLLLLYANACAPPRDYGFTAPLDERPEATIALANTAADCIVAQLEAQGLTQPGVAAKALRSANAMIVLYDDPIVAVDASGKALMHGWEESGSTDGSNVHAMIVYAMRAEIPHELVHVILCATQLGQCDSQHQARAWWLPVTEPCKVLQ